MATRWVGSGPANSFTGAEIKPAALGLLAQGNRQLQDGLEQRSMDTAVEEGKS